MTATILAFAATAEAALLAAHPITRPIAAAAIPRRLPSPAIVSPAVDLTRVRVRLEGYTSYSVVSALIMNAALRVLTSTAVEIKPQTWKTRVAQSAFLIFITISVLCGAYTTVNFALVSVYAKTAIGIGLDEQCATLLKLTQPYRAMAFRSFVGCLSSFCFAFPLAIYFKLRVEIEKGEDAWKSRAPAVATAALLIGFAITLRMCRDWISIISTATEHVYKARVALGR